MKLKTFSSALQRAVTSITTISILQFGGFADNLHPERIYLSGEDAGNPVKWGFYCSDGHRSGVQDSIDVPCNWELQGFGDFTYGRWYKIKGASPSKETGTYATRFTMPVHTDKQRVFIVFDGVMTDCQVKVNGQPAGDVHQGGFYRFKRDITPLLRDGHENVLEVVVDKHSTNKSVNAAERKADWWLYGGIYRPVWLEVIPEGGMRHIVFDARHDGSMTTRVELIGLSPDSRSLRVSLNGRDEIFTAKVNPGDSVILVDSSWKGIKPWTSETPALYTAKVELLDDKGDVIQTGTERIGFRTIEFVPRDGFYLNGTKIILKGVNRHSFSTTGGRAVSRRQNIEDARLIKEMNMNAVRGHYPPDESFLYACDSLGILCINELAGWQNAYDDRVGAVLVKEMIERDVNHPGIVIWSNGNEGGWNTNLDSLFAAYDMLQQRHVVHPWADFNEVDTHHYPTYLTGVARFTNGYKVFMPTEFMHAMYDQGGGAGLRDFWDRWKTNPAFAGGFIWAFCDEAPARMDSDGHLDSDGSNAPDGILGPRREREGSFYAVREQWCPVRIKPFRVSSHWDGTFKVTNEHDFLLLSDCKMDYTLKSVKSPAERKNDKLTDVLEAQVELPDAHPGETRTAYVGYDPSSSLWSESDVLGLEARYDGIGMDKRTIGEWSYPIYNASDYYDRHVSQSTRAVAPRKSRVSVKETADAYTLVSSSLKVSFSRSTGELQEIVAGGKPFPLTDGPRPVGMKVKYLPEKSYVRMDGADAVFCARYNGGIDSIVWRLTPAGLLDMDALLLNRAGGGGGFDDAFMDTDVYNLGLSFTYPETLCKGMEWLGAGPYRVWKNRLAGARFGLWHKDYNNTVTGESYDSLIYPEFKGYHANMYWATLESDSSPFTIYSRSDGLYYHIFTPEEPAAAESATMPRFPAEGNLSFLLEIPAIRSFKPIEQQGPGSQPGNIRIKKGDEGLHINVTFDFLKDNI